MPKIKITRTSTCTVDTDKVDAGIIEEITAKFELVEGEPIIDEQYQEYFEDLVEEDEDQFNDFLAQDPEGSNIFTVTVEK